MFKRMMDRVRLLLVWPLYSRQKKLFESRDAWTREQFIDHFVALGTRADIAATVWDALVPDCIVFDRFRPMPEDSFYHVFGLAEEDLDEDVVLDVLKRCGCRIPTPAETAHTDPVGTVADLVAFAAKMRQ